MCDFSDSCAVEAFFLNAFEIEITVKALCVTLKHVVNFIVAPFLWLSYTFPEKRLSTFASRELQSFVPAKNEIKFSSGENVTYFLTAQRENEQIG